jgi:NitT/TauT family transport system permease protein/putative hydroxymethylpyrimidine transport system permease protein
VIAAAVLVALLGGWELYSDLGGVDSLILPAPHEVAASLWNDSGVLWANFTVTAREVLLGIVVAVALGVALAVLIHFSRVARRGLYPLLVGSQAIPVVIVAPLLVTWFGIGIGPKLVIVGLVCFFPVVVPTLDALARVDPELLKLMRTLGASRRQTFLRVEAPSALPALLSGARISVATAVIGAVLAEQGSATEGTGGLGHLIVYAGGQLDTAEAYAAVVILTALALIVFVLLTVAERRLAPWTRPAREELIA